VAGSSEAMLSIGARQPRTSLAVQRPQPIQAAAVCRRAGQFDKNAFLRQEEFDPLSLQSFRREALLQYRNTNQSEPLRIYLSLFVFLSSIGSPLLSPQDAGPTYFAGVFAVFLASGAFFIREREKRTKQIVRLQREYSMGDLQVEIVEAATQSAKRCALQSLRAKMRIVALYGTGPQLCEAIAAAAPYRRRLQRSQVVVVPLSAGKAKEAELAASTALGGPGGLRAARSWLGSAVGARAWRGYFEELLTDREDTLGRGTWVALNFKGRVIGSNFGSPVWDELLAALPPVLPLSSVEEFFAGAESRDALDAQAEFYQALCKGDSAAIASLFVREDDQELSFAVEVDADGKRTNLSTWETVLLPENRPELVVASQDAVLSGPGEAITTCIEFPVVGPTLLATQVWRKMPTEDGSEMEWRLLSHRTIPYAPSTEARVALRCDHRGCVAFGKQLDAMR